MPLAGQLAAAVTVEGPVDHPQLHARLDGRDLKAGAAAFDQVRLDAKVADATQPRAAIEGSFRGSGLDGSLSVMADAERSEGAGDPGLGFEGRG